MELSRRPLLGTSIVLGVTLVLTHCGLSLSGEAPLDTDASDTDALGTNTDTDARQDAGAGLSDANVSVADGGDAAGVLAFCDSLDTALILCVPFEDTISDRSTHAQAIKVGGPVAYTTGKQGKAATLASTTTMVVAQNPAWTYTSLTFEVWMQPSVLPSGGGRFGLLDKQNSFGIFVQSNGDVSCNMGGGATANIAKVGVWTHVACANGGGELVLYADGKAVATSNGSPLSPGTEVAAIGGDSPNGGNAFVGNLDSLRVYARKKTAAEIAAAAK